MAKVKIGSEFKYISFNKKEHSNYTFGNTYKAIDVVDDTVFFLDDFGTRDFWYYSKDNNINSGHILFEFIEKEDGDVEKQIKYLLTKEDETTKIEATNLSTKQILSIIDILENKDV